MGIMTKTLVERKVVKQTTIIIIGGGFLSLIFRFLLFTMFFVECNPYTLDSHGVGWLVLLLNLVLLTVPS